MKRLDHQVGGRSARQLTEGALLAALTVVLALITAYIPLAGWITALLLPTPTAVLVMRHDVRTAVVSTVVAGLLLFSFLGLLGAALTWIQVVGIGVPLGLGFKRQWRAWRTLATMTAAFLVMALVGLGASIYIMGLNPLEVAFQAYRDSGEFAATLVERFGGGPPGVGDAEDFAIWWEQAVDAAMMLLPVGLVMGYFGFALVTYSLNRAVFQRLGYQVPAVQPFIYWQLPVASLYIFAAFLIVIWLLNYLGYPPGDAVYFNGLYAFMFAFAVNGCASAYAFMRRWRWSQGVAVLLLLGMIFLGLIMPLAWLGMADPVLKLRERYPPEASGGEDNG